MAKPAKQQQGRSLWGRMLGRAPSAAKIERKAPPLVAPVTHRALTAKDALYRLDSQGTRQYVPLTVADVPGRWAGRCWCHCGDLDGVLLVAWHERDDPGAVMRWKILADNAVMVTESAA